MSLRDLLKLFAVIASAFLAHVRAQGPASPPNSMQLPRAPGRQQIVERSSATDAARYLAGLPVSAQSPLTGLTRDPLWIAHSNVMNAGFSKLDQRQLSNIRIWRAELLAP